MTINLEFFETMKEHEPMRGQENESWCGPACIQEILKRRLKLGISQAELSRRMNTTEENGTSQEDMVRILREFGLDIYATTTKPLDKLNKIRKKGAEIILNWMSGRNEENDGHYSILDALNENYIGLNNPSFKGSYNILRRQDFENIWYDIEADGRRVDKWALIVK